jgi:hypothetical protein
MSGGFFAKLTPEQQQAALEYRGPENIGGQTMTRTFTDEELDALARIEQALTEARAEIERLRGALEWYGEQTRLCRIIHSEGDKGRNALSDDGGKRARAALAPATPPAQKDAAPLSVITSTEKKES